MRTTPRKAGREPVEGARFLGDVVAANLRMLRTREKLNQTELAERMGWLGHDWSRATVSDIERSGRNVTVDELFALGLLLNSTVPALLDPTGIDGQSRESLDYGGTSTMRADIASRFVRGQVALSMPAPDTLALEPVDETFDSAAATIDGMSQMAKKQEKQAKRPKKGQS